MNVIDWRYFRSGSALVETIDQAFQIFLAAGARLGFQIVFVDIGSEVIEILFTGKDRAARSPSQPAYRSETWFLREPFSSRAEALRSPRAIASIWVQNNTFGAFARTPGCAFVRSDMNQGWPAASLCSVEVYFSFF
jgi:hypothetical protein